MYVFDIDKLRLGDIILIRSNSRISQMVRRLTQSKYSHAILYVEICSVIDSDGYGVQSNNLQRRLIEKEDDAVVLRIKDEISTGILDKVEEFARRKIGTEYSTEEAKVAMINKELEAKEPNRQFCTRFIAQSYKYAGIELVENPDYCVPEELLNSNKLMIVDNVLRKASKKEIEFANSENPLEKQHEIHNSIFQRARELSGKDVQTFEDINEVLVSMGEIDSDLTDFVKKSGFLTMMEEDVEKNPWHYDADKMIEHYKNPEAIVNTAMFFATEESKIRERLNISICSLIQLDKIFPREYFKMEIELYRKLIRYSHTREREAIKVLKYY